MFLENTFSNLKILRDLAPRKMMEGKAERGRLHTPEK